MARDDVLEEMAKVAEDRWNEWPEELPEPFRVMARAWWYVIVGLQRVRLVAILARLHVPPGLAIELAAHWPVRLLPAFDPEKWEIDRKTPPGCSRRG